MKLIKRKKNNAYQRKMAKIKSLKNKKPKEFLKFFYANKSTPLKNSENLKEKYFLIAQSKKSNKN